MAAYNAGNADRDTTVARLEPLLADLEGLEQADAFKLLLRGFLRSLDGDRAGYRAMMEGCRELWAENRQRPHELTAIHRLCELDGDEAGFRAAAAELRSLSVADPARFALLYAGPLPRFPNGAA
jgi:hypothetical protein